MENKIFFLPGDVVTIKQDIPNKPTMLVVKKVKKTVRVQDIKNDYFQGILCRWFTLEGVLQEAIFNTKDIYKV
jgi:uncharacterized protein YodC (DUF2158 family)